MLLKVLNSPKSYKWFIIVSEGECVHVGQLNRPIGSQLSATSDTHLCYLGFAFHRPVNVQNREAQDKKRRERIQYNKLLQLLPHDQLRSSCHVALCRIEEDMVEGFLYEVPEEYINMPFLKRRVVYMKAKIKDNPNLQDCVFHIVVDGYNAPVTAGNFVDLAERNFYNGMEIQKCKTSNFPHTHIHIYIYIVYGKFLLING
ncbi:hypothetical protein YC2023_067001 [Brassica napus]